MSRPISTGVPILEGTAVLYQRKRSAAWQLRYKVSNEWVRASTKTKDLDKAKRAATEILLEAKYREKLGIAPISRRFSSVAEQAKKRMEEANSSGQGKAVFKDYATAIDTYLIPFFGKHNVDRITYELINQFAAWREDKMSKAPKASTITTHNSALNRVFDEAMLRGYMTKAQLPALKNKGKDGLRRPAFELNEYKQLYRYMRTWVKKGKKGKPTDMRYLLRDYVLILANTGMRHGTESYGLKWKNIQFINENKKTYLLMSVNGKNGQGELIARPNCRRYLDRIRKRSKDLKEYKTLEELIAAGVDKEVFRLPDGTATQNLHQPFRTLMKQSGLAKDRQTNQQRTLYSLRHSYATWALLNGVSHHILAKQMRTSIGMLEQHYSHVTVRMAKDQLSGK
jgi:integrase